MIQYMMNLLEAGYLRLR